MINIMCRDELLKVSISKEKITLKRSKTLIGKGVRMIQQNSVKSILIEYDQFSILDKNAMAFFNKILCNNSSISFEMNMI